MDGSPPGSVHGILQARISEWVAVLFSRGSSDPGIELVSLKSNLQVARFRGKPAFTTSATWESPKSGNQTSDYNQPPGPGERIRLF